MISILLSVIVLLQPVPVKPSCEETLTIMEQAIKDDEIAINNLLAGSDLLKKRLETKDLAIDVLTRENERLRDQIAALHALTDELQLQLDSCQNVRKKERVLGKLKIVASGLAGYGVCSIVD